MVPQIQTPRHQKKRREPNHSEPTRSPSPVRVLCAWCVTPERRETRVTVFPTPDTTQRSPASPNRAQPDTFNSDSHGRTTPRASERRTETLSPLERGTNTTTLTTT